MIVYFQDFGGLEQDQTNDIHLFLWLFLFVSVVPVGSNTLVQRSNWLFRNINLFSHFIEWMNMKIFLYFIIENICSGVRYLNLKHTLTTVNKYFEGIS